MKEQTIVGAGLSGMVAAITLARKGYEVLVRERRPQVGGPITMGDLKDKVIMVGDGTPMDLEAMERYVGIDLSPAAVPLSSVKIHAYGKTREIGFPPQVRTYMFERGPRPSSLDSYLFRIAEEEGVRFAFDDHLLEKDFSNLPQGTIIATGLFAESMQALEIPHIPIFAYVSSGETDKKDAQVIIYYDKYTRDYAFYMRVAGIQAAVLFSRGWPLKEEGMNKFREDLKQNDGIEFPEWMAVNVGSMPWGHYRPPGLFHKDHILTGTLSGTQEPFFLFGVHGALLSGKIAALAVEEPVIAEREFRRINITYPIGFAASNFYRYCPLFLLKRLIWLGLAVYPHVDILLGKRVYVLVPGYFRI